MTDDDTHPELAGYEPGDGRPLRGPRTVRMMRVVVIVGLVALILPGIIVTVSTASRTATVACATVVSAQAPDSVGSEPRFELTGPAGPGWYCYIVNFGGPEERLRYLGLIPEIRVVPVEPRSTVPQDS